MNKLARTLAALTIVFALLGAGVARAASVYAVRSGVNPGAVYQFGVGGDGNLSLLSPSSVATGGYYSRDVGIAPDGLHLYATDTESSLLAQFGIGAGGLLSALSPATVAVAKQSYAIAISPDGSSLYTGHNSPTSRIEQLTIGADGRLTAKSPASLGVDGVDDIVLSPDGQYLYASNFGSPGHISEFAVQADGTLKPLTPATVGTGPWPVEMAVSPDGHNLYAGTESSSGVLQFAIGADGQLAPMVPANLPQPGGNGAEQLAVSADGTNLYAIGGEGGIAQMAIGAGGALSLLEPGLVEAGVNTESLAVSPDGRSLYVGFYDGELLRRFSIGAGGALTATDNEFPQTHLVTGIAVSPDQGPTAKLAVTPAVAGKATSFDAAGSSDPDGQVARYDWSFGDGATATTTAAQASHVYARGGDYDASVTVTDDEGASATRVFTGHQVLRNGGPAATATSGFHVSALPPKISKAKVKPGRLHAGKGRHHSARLSFRLDSAGTVVVQVQQRRAGHHHNGKCSLVAKQGKPCFAWKTLKGSRVLQGRRGIDRLAFSGSVVGRRERPGVYRFVLTPRSEGQIGGRAYAGFRLLPSGS